VAQSGILRKPVWILRWRLGEIVGLCFAQNYPGTQLAAIRKLCISMLGFKIQIRANCVVLLHCVAFRVKEDTNREPLKFLHMDASATPAPKQDFNHSVLSRSGIIMKRDSRNFWKILYQKYLGKT
jgi:hypothetical protein